MVNRYGNANANLVDSFEELRISLTTGIGDIDDFFNTLNNAMG